MAKGKNGGRAKAPEEAPAAQNGNGNGNGNGQRDRPAFELRKGRVKATVWANASAEGVWYSCSFTRSYKDQQDNWKSASSFGKDDLLVVAELARRAWDWVTDTLQSERAAANGHHHAPNNGATVGDSYEGNDGGGESFP